jgi:heme-degrading monooxygenase HmoA
MQLAQINVARLLYGQDDPRLADFIDNLDRVNALAEGSEGFLWRLKDETGNATQIAFDDDPRVIVNMSVWESVEALEAFAYKTVHRRFVQRRKEWFSLFGAPYVALWWIEDGRWPDALEGRRRLAHLGQYGPSPYAFTFKSRFGADVDALPLGPVDGDSAPGEPFRACG